MVKKKKNDAVFVSTATKRRRFAGLKNLKLKCPSCSSSGKIKKSEGGRRREEEEEGGRKKCRRRGRKKKSKPVVGAGGPAQFPGRQLDVLHSAASLRGGKKNLRSNLGTRR